METTTNAFRKTPLGQLPAEIRSAVWTYILGDTSTFRVAGRDTSNAYPFPFPHEFRRLSCVSREFGNLVCDDLDADFKLIFDDAGGSSPVDGSPRCLQLASKSSFLPKPCRDECSIRETHFQVHGVLPG